MGDPLVTVVLRSRGATDVLAQASRTDLARQTLNEIEIIDAADATSRPRGRWIAHMDAGDRMHPDRLRRLVEAAEREGAMAICDDVLRFDPDCSRSPRPVLREGRRTRRPTWLEPHRPRDAALLARLMPIVRAQPTQESSSAAPVLCLPLPLYFRSAAAARPTRPRELVVLSRQRVSGATNGGSAYLLSLCEALAKAGWRIRYLGPSPATFGRWPVIRLRRETKVFSRIDLRGGVRVGPLLVSLDPRRGLAAAATIAARVATKLGFAAPPWDKPAPYAIALPWTRAEALFVARGARGCAAVLCDYAQLAELAPFAGPPWERRAVVMHDLVHARAARFSAHGARDSVADLPAEDEFRMLGQGGAVVAIQDQEARLVRAALPNVPVFLETMTPQPAARAAPGEDHLALFVGSAAAPNVDALAWFCAEIWPRVRAAAPNAELIVAGAVARRFAAPPQGVRLRGPVADLAPLYARAGVVAAPLRLGSGLKIKLVEAMAYGKAIVATAATLEGIEEAESHGVTRADDAESFAAALIALLGDRQARLTRAQAALAHATQRFAALRSHRELVDWFASAIERRSPLTHCHPRWE